MATVREDQATILLTVYDSNGNPQSIISERPSWYSYSGADLAAAGSKTRSGGMGTEEELGGPASRADCTLTVQQDDVMIGWHAFLESRVGKGRAVVTLMYKDDEGNLRPGETFSANGKLLGASLGGQNGGNANAVMYTVKLGLNELAG